MTEDQENARRQLRRIVTRRVVGAISGSTIEVNAEDLREVLTLIDDLEARIAELCGE